MATFTQQYAAAYTRPEARQAIATKNKKPLIEDRDLLNQQLGDSGREKRKKRNSLPTILGAGLQTDTTLQTLLGS